MFLAGGGIGVHFGIAPWPEKLAGGTGQKSKADFRVELGLTVLHCSGSRCDPDRPVLSMGFGDFPDQLNRCRYFPRIAD